MPSKKQKHKSRGRFFKTFITLLLIMCVLAFLTRLLVFTPISVMSDGMSPLYRKGDVVFASKLELLTGWHVARNEIVLASFESADAEYLRRVVGIPGDVIDEAADGEKLLIYTNAAGDKQTRPLGECPALSTGTLPEGSYLLLADKPEADGAFDSRSLGLVHSTDIRAKAGAILWPIDRMFR